MIPKKHFGRAKYLGLRYLPWLGLALGLPLLLFALHASCHLGRWPVYDQPDPKELAFYEIYHVAIEFSFTVQFFALVLWVVVTVFSLNDRNRWRLTLVGAGVWLLIFLNIATDPLGLIEWYVD